MGGFEDGDEAAFGVGEGLAGVGDLVLSLVEDASGVLESRGQPEAVSVEEAAHPAKRSRAQVAGTAQQGDDFGEGAGEVEQLSGVDVADDGVVNLPDGMGELVGSVAVDPGEQVHEQVVAAAERVEFVGESNEQMLRPATLPQVGVGRPARRLESQSAHRGVSPR